MFNTLDNGLIKFSSGRFYTIIDTIRKTVVNFLFLVVNNLGWTVKKFIKKKR